MRPPIQCLRLAVSIAFALLMMTLPALAWNPPGHMLSGSITYQILRRESVHAVETVKSILERHPWYQTTHWKAQLEKLSSIDRDEMLFMLAPRWADDVRTQDRDRYHRGSWHYINFPFKPAGQPETVRTRPPEPINILTALAENERIARTDISVENRAIALTWLFHLVGDLHQPLHTIQIFTTALNKGDRGGNEICVRWTLSPKPIELHRFWDRVITSGTTVTGLRNEATAIRNREEFSRSQLTELTSTNFESWAREGVEIASKIAYQNGAFLGTLKGNHRDCNELADAVALPAYYAKIAKWIADRRIILAGYRLADVLKRITGK